MPDQGWKLHVSATVVSCEQTLGRVLPLLVGERASFKVAASVQHLAELNDGEGGVSQIGKFITVYPEDDEQAVRLTARLDEATRGLAGPEVPSDRPLRRGSAVHYRYGGFDERIVQLPYGEIAPAIVRPDGELIPDRRSVAYEAPEWVEDPFLAAGVAESLEPPELLIDGRLLLASLLHTSPRGTVHLSLDLEHGRRCIVKRGRTGEAVAADGRDARDRLRHEFEVLSLLQESRCFPAPYELIESDGEILLVMEDVEGPTLAAYVAKGRAVGRLPRTETVTEWGIQLARAMGVVHDHGFVYRDVKPTNVIVEPSGSLRIVDLELAHDPSSTRPPLSLGTRGYMSPQQAAGRRPTIADDVYGLGALLYFAATGAEPSQTPASRPLLERPPGLVNPALGGGVIAVLENCLDPRPEARFQSMAELEAALARGGGSAAGSAAADRAVTANPESSQGGSFREQAQRLGDTLVALARPAPEGKGKAWTSEHFAAMRGRSRDLNAGTAGIVLALCELVAESRDPAKRETLEQAARWLTVAPAPPGQPPAGLYVGECGIAAALLRAGQVLEDPALVSAALERARDAARAEHRSPDLFNGTAGRLRTHLLLWDETGEPDQLEAARAAGDALLRSAEAAGRGELQWAIPSGHGEMSGKAPLGYAHGVAGIADALLDLLEVTGEDRLLGAAQGAARRLVRLGVPALDDESGLEWPQLEGGWPIGPMWCHGSTGIGRFFLHAGRIDAVPQALDVAQRAAASVARGRSLGPVQCHGLAGSIEFLLDMYQFTGDPAHLREAHSLGRLLEGFRVERDGHLMWSSDRAEVLAPDYMVGYSGVAVCLLRLADAERRPHQLSRAGYRWTAPRESASPTGSRHG